MTERSNKAAFVLATLLCAGALPISATLAGTSQTASPTTMIGNDSRAQVDGRYHSLKNGIGNYDGFDRFRDPTGRPLPGWEFLFYSPG